MHGNTLPSEFISTLHNFHTCFKEIITHIESYKTHYMILNLKLPDKKVVWILPWNLVWILQRNLRVVQILLLRLRPFPHVIVEEENNVIINTVMDAV